MDEKAYSLNTSNSEQDHFQEILRLAWAPNSLEWKGAKADETFPWDRKYISRSGMGWSVRWIQHQLFKWSKSARKRHLLCWEIRILTRLSVLGRNNRRKNGLQYVTLSGDSRRQPNNEDEPCEQQSEGHWLQIKRNPLWIDERSPSYKWHLCGL